MTGNALKRYIRDIPDFPKPGVVFRDITPLIGDAKAFTTAVQMLAGQVAAYRPDGIVAIESRGFIFGAAVARELGLPMQLVRKQGKLPYRTLSISYDLEYGSDAVEVHVDAIQSGLRYAIIDDLIATGGTASATAQLVAKADGEIACLAFLIELLSLRGRKRLEGLEIRSLVQYE